MAKIISICCVFLELNYSEQKSLAHNVCCNFGPVNRIMGIIAYMR